MMDPSSRPPRKVGIADHIWLAFEEMAQQMGSDRDALINQAMFMFARLNGFMDSAAGGNGRPADVGTPAIAQPPPPPPRAPAGATAPPRAAQAPAAPPMLKPAGGAGRAPPPPPPPPPAPEVSGNMDDDPVRREVQERVLETAAELERLIKAKNQGGGAPPPPEPPPDDSSGGDDVPVDDSQADGAGPALYMTLEGGELDRITKERFIIGRGKHCDFVINSGKVSREHAVIIRENGEFFLEDLGSSNGTWFNKQRIKRRKIEDGDEYFICSEKVKFVYR